ncbi:hypothetical protein [Flavobacterium chungangense]|uniref:Uncharacterized protein n=1 Tax=Flavobacterium chungangense TaxID=554283 RepID=A0A6V6YX05_9FLAO|nr:hypothetical protein [Flavobacterium chungangense]CAD0004057.1 hypothetical protein FLACHUCJ7_01705 [Flavobacterium chungangense]
MTIYRSSGKNTEIYEEYELYTREYTENVGGKSTFTAKGGTTYGNKPETAKPLGITNLYVKVRLNDNYNGEFGFDWIDVNPETKEIEKIQDVPFSEVEYFYKKGATPTDLGDIVATSTDPIGAKHAIQDHYNFNPISKHVDIPYVLIKCDQEITLSAEIILWQGEIKDDVITITGDEFYEFDIIGGEKEGKTAKIKLTKAGKIDFKVKCLEEGSEKKYEFKHSNPVTGSHSVGGLIMMENNELKLKFRVIALVSSDGNPNEKAKALFKKFKDNKIFDYLNKNSLNQAGYKVEIENYDEMDNSDVDDYLYAFNKEDWKTKQLFKEQYNKKYWDKVLKPDGSYELEPDGKHYKMVLTDNPPKPIDILTEDEIDYKTIEAYKTKLISKSKTYNGGLLILSDYESPSQTVAFSRTTPLDHYALLIYSNGIEKQENYAHEIGHMLGLPHSFYMDKEKEAYNNARENVLGNGLPEKNPNGTNNVKYRAGINRNIQKVKDEAKNSNLSDIYRPTSVTAIKNDIIKYLNNFNKIYSIKVNKEKTDKKHIETTYVNYRDNDKINQTQTKGEYLSIYNKNIKRWNDYIDENEKAIVEVNKYKGNKFETIKTNMNFIRPDYIILLEETKKYYLNIISQTHSNYIIFKKSSTKNMMDYENEKMRFLHNQVKIMRDDMQNY